MRERVIEAARHNLAEPVRGQCLCGAVSLEIDFPARWAWHDHSYPSRLAHWAAYATYVGSWRKRFRITNGQKLVARYEDGTAGTGRSFCSRCGTPLTYETKLSPHMVNISRGFVFEPHRASAALPFSFFGTAGLGVHRCSALSA
jgi:hypothetical protein